jgi:hypothetical protein
LVTFLALTILPNIILPSFFLLLFFIPLAMDISVLFSYKHSIFVIII